jgi:telomerase protein component 1
MLQSYSHFSIRYPSDYEAFRISRLPGTFDEAKAGSRLKLPTPETWETQLAK